MVNVLPVRAFRSRRVAWVSGRIPMSRKTSETWGTRYFPCYLPFRRVDQTWVPGFSRPLREVGADHGCRSGYGPARQPGLPCNLHQHLCASYVVAKCWPEISMHAGFAFSKVWRRAYTLGDHGL
jgi:hypothetical protein